MDGGDGTGFFFGKGWLNNVLLCCCCSLVYSWKDRGRIKEIM
jgi:hypothetical protein